MFGHLFLEMVRPLHNPVVSIIEVQYIALSDDKFSKLIAGPIDDFIGCNQDEIEPASCTQPWESMTAYLRGQTAS